MTDCNPAPVSDIISQRSINASFRNPVNSSCYRAVRTLTKHRYRLSSKLVLYTKLPITSETTKAADTGTNTADDWCKVRSLTLPHSAQSTQNQGRQVQTGTMISSEGIFSRQTAISSSRKKTNLGNSYLMIQAFM